MTRHFHPSRLAVLSATTHPTGPAPTISRAGFCIQQKTISSYYSKERLQSQAQCRNSRADSRPLFWVTSQFWQSGELRTIASGGGLTASERRTKRNGVGLLLSISLRGS